MDTYVVMRRSGWRSPEELEEIARHAKQVVWMTPEPRWSWALGGCDMPRYAPICDRVEVVRSVDELGHVAEVLALNDVRRTN